MNESISFPSEDRIVLISTLEADKVNNSSVWAAAEANGSMTRISSLSQLAPACCRLAFDHSFGLFDDIPDDVWRLHYLEPAQHPELFKISWNPNRKSYSKWVFFNLDPWFNCPRRVKLGGLGYSPKFTCDPDRLSTLIRRRSLINSSLELPESLPATKVQSNNRIGSSSRHCLVYSFVGTNETYQWEEALAQLLVASDGCEIHVFTTSDQNNSSLSRQKRSGALHDEMIHFHPISLVASSSSSFQKTKNSATKNHLSFEEIQRSLGHVGRPIDILKISCDGCV